MNGIRPRIWIALFIPALALALLELQWDHPLNFDEFEFFRASHWIGEGRVPYRDFWEHHLPLQWFLFAPFTALIHSPGAQAILTMRWMQLALWAATFAALVAVMRRAGLDASQRRIGILFLLTSMVFVLPALEFRVDVLGNLAYVAALAVVLSSASSRTTWIAFGAMMSLAVLANMRLAPFVVVTALLMTLVDPVARRWCFRRTALWMIAGVAVVVAIFAGYLFMSGAVDAFASGMRANIFFERASSGAKGTLTAILLAPLTDRDPGGIALIVVGVAGMIAALRDLRRPGILQVVAFLSLISLIAVVRLSVHYRYHLQTSLLLLAVTGASIVRPRAHKPALLLFALFIVTSAALRIGPAFGERLAYQDTVMRQVHRRTTPSERVFDGLGLAVHRQPAYRYWFLPAAVRVLAARGMIERYDAPQMASSPPAAIVHSYRLHLWFAMFPRLAGYATRHYVPLYRDLWIAAPNARLEPGRAARWVVPREGRYRVIASELLAKHPWFSEPLQYATVTRGASLFEISLAALPPEDRAPIRVLVDGAATEASEIVLKRGARVQVQSSARVPIAVILVPADVTTLFQCPTEELVM